MSSKEPTLPLSPTAKDPLSESTFRLLSTEIHLAILDLLPKNTLIKLAGTCTYFRAIILPLIYHTIDMTNHTFVQAIQVKHRKALNKRQFLKQILRNPEYGQYVKSLTWTVSANTYDTSYIMQVVKKTFKMFRLLKGVTYLDLQLKQGYRDYRFHVPALFPKAKQIALNGEMPYHFAIPIRFGERTTNYLRLSVVHCLDVKTLQSQSGDNIVSACECEDDVPSGLKQFEQAWPDYARHFRDFPSQVPPARATNYMIKQAHDTSPSTDPAINGSPPATTPSPSPSPSKSSNPPKDARPTELLLPFSNDFSPWNPADFPCVDPGLLLTQRRLVSDMDIHTHPCRLWILFGIPNSERA
ncbi:hypothetical protein ACMFMG_011765 [Clarireedia jacksonii]